MPIYYISLKYQILLEILALFLIRNMLVRRSQAANANQALNGLARVQIVGPPIFYKKLPRIRHFRERELFREYTGPMLIFVRNTNDLPYVLSLSYNIYSEIHFSAMSSSSHPVRSPSRPVRLRAFNQEAWPSRRNESFVSTVERNERMLKAQAYRAKKRTRLLQSHERYDPLDFVRKGNIAAIVDFQFGEFSFFDDPNYPSVSLNMALARPRMTAVRITPTVDHNLLLSVSLCVHQTPSFARSESQIALARVILIVVGLAMLYKMLNWLWVFATLAYSELLFGLAFLFSVLNRLRIFVRKACSERS